MRNLSKKAKTIIAGAAIAGLASTGVAYAYWTTTGSGDGSATSASANGTIDLYASFADGLTPGASEDVTFTADNLGTSSLYVGDITLASVSTDKPSCDVADFTMPDVTSNTTVAAGATGATLLGTGTLTFADTAFNQDECKGAIVTLHLTSN